MIRPYQKFILKFGEDDVQISSTKSIKKKDVDVGKEYEIRAGVIWEISVLKYFSNESRIYVEILDYDVFYESFSQQQEDTFEDIDLKKINFKSISTSGLLKSIKNKPRKVPGISAPRKKEENPVSTKILKPAPWKKEFSESEKKILGIGKYLEDDENEEKEISINFEMPIKKIAFHDGSVEFYNFIKEAERGVYFEIKKESFKKEYDAVKNYFSSFLGKKKINVIAKIIFTKREIISASASSTDLEKINEEAIESIRFKFYEQNFLQRIDEDLEQHIFTFEELEETLPTSKKSNPFTSEKNAKEKFLESVINIKNSKHYKQLRYLSSKHLSHVLKLRFILKPFSFVFLLENEEKYFLIWETLNTEEATYIWNFQPKTKEQLIHQLQKTESIIGQIKEGGKQLYIKSQPENFKRIYHDYSDKVSGFLKWKNEIDEYLKN